MLFKAIILKLKKRFSKIYSKEEMFGLMNKMMNGVSAQSKNEANDLNGLMNVFWRKLYF